MKAIYSIAKLKRRTDRNFGSVSIIMPEHNMESGFTQKEKKK